MSRTDSRRAGAALEDFRAVFREFWPAEIPLLYGNPSTAEELLRVFPQKDFHRVFVILDEAVREGNFILYTGSLEVLKRRCFERYMEREKSA